MLSLGADLGLGQPMEHCIRRTAIALRLADRLGLDDRDRATTYYLGLMMNVYCHADATEQAAWFGDDITFKSEGYETLGMNTAQVIAFFLRRIGSGGTGVERARRLAAFPVGGFREMQAVPEHPHAARRRVRGTDRARRDRRRPRCGRRTSSGTARASPNRLCRRCDRGVGPNRPACGRRRGLQPDARRGRGRAIVRRHRGGLFDPEIADVFEANMRRSSSTISMRRRPGHAVIDDEPWLDRRVAGAELDAVLEAMADLVDMKAPHMAGHSRGVANLAAEAGRLAGLPDGVDRRHCATRGPRPRPGPPGRLEHDLGQGGPAHRVGARTGPPAPVPARPDARPRPGARREPGDRRPPPRAARWQWLSGRPVRPRR